MSDENGNIAKAIFDSLVFLAYKGLETREVKDFQSMSTKFDKMTEQLKHQSGSQFQALTMDVPADLDLGEVGTDMPAEEPRHDLDSAVDDIVKTLQGLPADKNISVRKELIEKLEGLKVLGARIEEKDIGEVVSILQKRRDVWVDIEMQRASKMKLRQEQCSMVP
ncbi:MAG: hypothetical protein LBF25_01930 [Puniceicoccales bacterium]|jgi:hypothetical protein|nr:hypothetical protein [Puniceicoccales bacterium]